MKNTKVIVPILCTLLVIVIGLGIFQVVRLYNKPMAESLALPTESSKSEVQLASAMNSGSPTATAAPNAEPVCGNTGSMTILFTGADYSKGVWPLGADSVRLIKVDFDQQRVVMIAFPRDLVIKANGAAAENQGEQRLGLAYYYEQQATQGEDKDKVVAGTQVVAKALLDNFGVQPDHYLTLQFNSLEELFAAVGDVEIDNPTAFVSDYGVQFPAGKQTLTPALAAEFVRTSEPGYEEGRLARQKIFLNALQAKVVSAGIISQVPALLEQFNQVVTTDLSPKQLVDLGCMVEKVDKDKVEYYDIEGDELVTQGEKLSLLPKVDAIKDLIKKAFELN